VEPIRTGRREGRIVGVTEPGRQHIAFRSAVLNFLGACGGVGRMGCERRRERAWREIVDEREVEGEGMRE
jgi:hypothetical protein